MINTNRVVKTTLLFVTIAYLLCAFLVWLSPGVAIKIMDALFHAISLNVSETSMTLGKVLFGLAVADVLAVFYVWLFVTIYNRMK